MNLIEIANRTNEIALKLGADEVEVNVSRSISTELGQRKGKIEKSKQARSMGISVHLLVNGRYSSHSASDVREKAMTGFLEKAIAATKSLEPDLNRKLAELGAMGSAKVELDVMDQSWFDRSPKVRREELLSLENACLEASVNAPLRSVSVWLWDAMTESCKVCSNGHQSSWQRTSFGHGGEITLEDQDGRLPEAYDFYSARHHEDLPDVKEVAKTLVARGQSRIGSNAIRSQKLPMLLENRAVPRILSTLTGPMNGNSIYEKRSCLMDKLGQQIGAEGFNLHHDPHVPRGLSSHFTDSDGLPTKHLHLVKNGVLNHFFISIYNSRRLEMPVTTGSGANLIIPPGAREPAEILKNLQKAIRVEGFLGGNANPLTGDFSFGVSGTLFEKGEAVQGISEMNISGNLFTLLPKWRESASDTWKYGSCRSPSLLFEDIQFSGT